MSVRWGRPVEQVCNRKETTWYVNHEVNLRQSIQSELRVEPGRQLIREPLGRLWRYGLQVGASVGTHWLQKEHMGQEEVSSLSICLSIYLSNSVPLSRIKWERYIFIKKCVSYVHWSSFIIFDYILGWVYEKYTTIGALMAWCPIKTSIFWYDHTSRPLKNTNSILTSFNKLYGQTNL